MNSISMYCGSSVYELISVECSKFSYSLVMVVEYNSYLLKYKMINFMTYLVTLKTRSKRTQRKTDTPKGGISSLPVNTISVILPITTKQSKRLNSDTK